MQCEYRRKEVALKYFIDNYKGKDSVEDYWAEFNRIKKFLNPMIVEIFSSNSEGGTIHDSKITSISVVDVPHSGDYQFRHDVLLGIENDIYKGIWRHLNVSEFLMTKADFTTCGDMEYLYGEILVKKARFTHNFTCTPIDCEVYIECEDMIWESTM
jgi:hypothetical protein